MGRFVNTETGVTVSVDDSKDDRFDSDLWESADSSKAPAKKTASRSTSK